MLIIMVVWWNIVLDKKLPILFSLALIHHLWISKVFCGDIYREIHRVWPSLRMPNVIISQISSGEEKHSSNKTTDMSPTLPSLEPPSPSSKSSERKTVVFPSPICISLPMSPCFILQIFWRNSSSSVLGVNVPVSRIPSWPRPRERRLSNTEFYNMYVG